MILALMGLLHHYVRMIARWGVLIQFSRPSRGFSTEQLVISGCPAPETRELTLLHGPCLHHYCISQVVPTTRLLYSIAPSVLGM